MPWMLEKQSGCTLTGIIDCSSKWLGFYFIQNKELHDSHKLGCNHKTVITLWFRKTRLLQNTKKRRAILKLEKLLKRVLK